MAPNLNDIREWGRANGFDVVEGKPLPKGLRSAYQNRADSEVIVRIVPDEEEGARAVEEERPATVAERAPDVRKPGLVTRARAMVGKRADEAPRLSERKPRKAIDRIIERGWEVMARLVQPVNLPMARVLQTQAPVAGLLLEDVIKGTVVDKLLQPIARGEEKAELAFALIGPPILVGLLSSQRGQQFIPVLLPALKESLRLWLEVAGPKLEIARQRQEDFEKMYGAQIDVLIAGFFEPPPDVTIPNDGSN